MSEWSGFSIGGRGIRVQVTQGGRTFNILKDLDLDELSAVTVPAQSRALAHFAKADIINSKPIVSIGKAVIQKDQETNAMTDAEKKALEDRATAAESALAKAQSRITELETEVTRAVDLSPEHQAYAKRLSVAERAVFLAKGVGERTSAVTSARGAEVYKRRDGAVFYESDDQNLVEMWKMNDRLAAQLDEQKVANADVIAKADVAKHMSFFVGDDDGKLALMKAARGIADEKTRTAAIAVLEKANEALAIPYTRQGHSLPLGDGTGGVDGDVSKSATDKLEAKVDEIATEITKLRPGTPFAKARAEAYRDPRYGALVDQMETYGNR